MGTNYTNLRVPGPGTRGCNSGFRNSPCLIRRKRRKVSEHEDRLSDQDFGWIKSIFYVSRMIRFERNTIETHSCESDFETFEPQFETVQGSLTEKLIEDRYDVCAIDEVSHEHVRGFPVEIHLEKPEDDEDRGYVSTLNMKGRSHALRFREERKEAIFCGNTKHVAIGRTTETVTHVYGHVGALLPGDDHVTRVVMNAVQPFFR